MQQPNQLVCSDCLEVLATLPDAICHLVYLDPPFNTNSQRKSPNGRRHAHSHGSDDEVPAERAAFGDTFGSPATYVAYIRSRIEQLRRMLTPDGSLFFHCDWRMSHHVRLLLDDVFGIDRAEGVQMKGDEAQAWLPGVFVNEIVWHYGLGAARATRHLLTKHDVIFWYANSADYTFNPIRSGLTPAMKAKYCHVDEQGNRYMNSYGKRYLLKGGKPLDDVWDIPTIAPTSAERAGYPTQKPLALLTRIIELASNEGDTVLDPFCGSGTTMVAAQQMGRCWIGIDANPQAIAIARRRLGDAA